MSRGVFSLRIMDTQVEIARHVAPEDIAVGDYVTVAHVTYEFVGDCSSVPEQTVTPKRVTFMSPCAGRPLRVMSICLPYLFVREPEGGHDMLDLRRHRIMKLSKTYGKKVFKRLKPPKEDNSTL